MNDIYTCDLTLNGQEGGCLAGDEKTKVTNDSYGQYIPAISGDVIVWMSEGVFTYPINGYLTIMAAPNAIPYREDMTQPPAMENYRSLDQTQYGDLQYNDWFPDISTGRIMGLTPSDVSGYLARDIFYETLEKTENMKFMASSLSTLGEGPINNVIEWSSEFRDVGYNAISVTSPEECHDFDPEEWENQDLISYADHGNDHWAGIDYDEIPLLDNSIVINDACSTCSTYTVRSFCNRAIRQGALAHTGAVCIGWLGNTIYVNTVNGIYYEGLTIGQAFAKAYTPTSARYMTMLLGDPALDVKPPYLLEEPLGYQ